MIHKNWRSLVKKQFPFIPSNLPKVGDIVTGSVVANAPFGIWLDIGFRLPALLEIIQLNENYSPSDYPNWMPHIGEKMTATVVSIGDREIKLSQKVTNVTDWPKKS
jgi:ribosomal protein S1